VLEPGEAKVKEAVVPESPVCGLDPAIAATTVVSEAHVALEPLRRVTVNGAEPPDQLTAAVTFPDWPESRTTGERTGALGERTALTVTRVGVDVEVCGGTPESVTVTQ
jgi:hypothetical protein